MRTPLALTLSALLLLGGCGGHSKKATSLGSSTAAPLTTATTGSNPDLLLSVTATAPAEALMSGDLVALAFRLTAAGQAPVELTSITVTASGSVDAEAAIGALALVGDDNGDGRLDPGEPVLAMAAAPAFAAGSGAVTLTLPAPLTLAPGASLSLLVTADVSAVGRAGLGRVGQTLELAVATADDLALSVGGQPPSIAGSFPLTSGPVTLFLNDHLLFSEVVGPTLGTRWGEGYMEVFNPTAHPVDLSNYYLTDAHDPSNTPPRNEYYNLPLGRDFTPARPSLDFLVRFPQGSILASGAVVTVAVSGTEFAATYNQPADFCLRDADAGAVQMLKSDGASPPNWVDEPSDGQVFSGGERVLLFFWDGQSDLVQDVDYLFIGSHWGTNRPVDKTGVTINGIPYLPDTPAAQQVWVPTPRDPELAAQRLDFSAAGMTRAGGNGITGADVTSEPSDITFGHAVPTPGMP